MTGLGELFPGKVELFPGADGLHPIRHHFSFTLDVQCSYTLSSNSFHVS